LATVAITYLTDQLQFTARENGVAILLMLCGSVPGGIISNIFTRNFDPKRSTMLALLLLIVTTALFALFANGPGQFVRTYVLAFFWGLGVGWTWTCNRLMASSIIPEGQDTELMGVFLFSGQCLSWMPPLVFTAINEAGVSQRIGVASLDVYLVISLICYGFMGSYTSAREEVNRTTVFAKGEAPTTELAETEPPTRIVATDIVLGDTQYHIEAGCRMKGEITDSSNTVVKISENLGATEATDIIESPPVTNCDI
jgi:MFS family permease